MTSAVVFKLVKNNLAVKVAIPKPADGAGGIFWNEPTDQNCLLSMAGVANHRQVDLPKSFQLFQVFPLWEVIAPHQPLKSEFSRR